MAKRKAKDKRLTRKQLSRRERDRSLEQKMTWIAVAVGVIVVALLGYGVVAGLIIEPNRPVARVDDVEITTGEYQSRLDYEREMTEYQLRWYNGILAQINTAENPEAQGLAQQIQLEAAQLEQRLSPDFANVLGRQVLDTMIEEELVRSEAAERRISAEEEEVDERVEQFVKSIAIQYRGLIQIPEEITSTEQIDSSLYPQVYKSFQTQVLQPSGLSQETFREMFRAQVLKEQLQEELAQDVETTADQVQAAVMIAPTVEQAQELYERVEAGEDVEALIEELNNDEDQDVGGYSIPWLPIGYLGSQLSPEIEQVAFNTPVGEVAEPILAPDGTYYVIYVTGHEERPLAENLLNQSRQQEYNVWLQEQQETRAEYLDWGSALEE